MHIDNKEIIVDELPKNCRHCRFFQEVKKGWWIFDTPFIGKCLLTNKEQTHEMGFVVCPDNYGCPLKRKSYTFLERVYIGYTYFEKHCKSCEYDATWEDAILFRFFKEIKEDEKIMKVIRDMDSCKKESNPFEVNE